MIAFFPMCSKTECIPMHSKSEIPKEILNGGFYFSVGSCVLRPTQYLLHLYILTLLGFSLQSSDGK